MKKIIIKTIIIMKIMGMYNMTKEEREQWGIEEDGSVKGDVGYHSGAIFKTANCNLHEVEENTEEGNYST